ncbi:hypothetical protein DUGA2_00010 [Duganella sp. HH101]|nr:hypothetical protein DUGA2_00010 [Duganella sp. HH101]
MQRGPAGGAVAMGETALSVQKTATASPGWSLAGAAPAARQAGGDEGEAVPMQASRGQDPADGEEYAARLLHVYRDADGVQAWLRDAGIGTAQAHQVALAMAAELGGAGAPLTALTVNGQRLPLAAGAQPGPRDQDEDTGDGMAPQYGAAPSPLKTNANGAV